MAHLAIIIGSTRPGRAGGPVAEWFAAHAEQHASFDPVDLIDLAEVDLPMLDEPNHPRMRDYTHEHTKRWSARIDRSDAVVFVTPEYNFGMPASIKNALDFIFHEWRYKPAGIVSYGGVSAGTRSAQMLKQVLSALDMPVVGSAVSIPFIARRRNDDGSLDANDKMDDAARSMLDELARWEQALRPMRETARAKQASA